MKIALNKRLSLRDKVVYMLEHLCLLPVVSYDVYSVLDILLPVVTKYTNSLPKLILSMGLTSLLGYVTNITIDKSTDYTIRHLTSGMVVYVILTLGRFTPLLLLKILIGVILISYIDISILLAKLSLMKKGKSIDPTRKILYLIKRDIALGLAVAIILVPLKVRFCEKEYLYYRRLQQQQQENYPSSDEFLLTSYALIEVEPLKFLENDCF